MEIAPSTPSDWDLDLPRGDVKEDLRDVQSMQGVFVSGIQIQYERNQTPSFFDSRTFPSRSDLHPFLMLLVQHRFIVYASFSEERREQCVYFFSSYN